VAALERQEPRNTTSLEAVIAKLGTLPADKQAQAGTLMAIHIQQEQKLAAFQTQRRTNCASAAYKSAHKAQCAKANPVTEAAERLKLSELELVELQALLAGFWT